MKKDRKKRCKVAFLTLIFLKLWCDMIFTPGHVLEPFWVWYSPTFSDILLTLPAVFLQLSSTFPQLPGCASVLLENFPDDSRKIVLSKNLRVTDLEEGILKGKIKLSSTKVIHDSTEKLQLKESIIVLNRINRRGFYTVKYII